MKKLILLILFFLNLTAHAASPLPAEQAFQFSATAKDYQTILVQWKMAPGNYLYEKHFSFTVLKPKNVILGDPLYPSGAHLLKTQLGTFSVYSNDMIIPIPIIAANEKSLILQVKYQGCSHAGYCYPPTIKTVSINLASHYMQWVNGATIHAAPALAPTTPIQKSFLLTLISFFGFGILLSLTPCVLPMIPILSSIILGRKNQSHWHAFLLSLFYVLGMALLYTVIGIVFGAIGKNIQLIFQNPYVIVSFSFLFVLMALSMFGLFQLQLPEKFQTFISKKSEHQKRGTYAGAFIMGALSTLILSPCVTPPLVAAVGYISQSGNTWLGGSALFAMGLGSGLPLLLMGALGPKILPKPGQWMNLIKYMIGVLLLVVAFMMASRVLFTSKPVLSFQPVQTVSAVNTVLNNAGNKVVMLDFYADWCIACKELDKTTFSQPAVQAKLKTLILLRVDITANSAENAAIMQHYGVIAPPTILFFQHRQEIPSSRIIGYQPPKRFLKHLKY